MPRTTHEIIRDHLALRKEGRVDEDIERNYAEHVIIIDSDMVYRGHDGVRKSMARLATHLPNAEFFYKRTVTTSRAGYLVWKAKGKNVRVDHGVDSFVVENGKIVVQTIYYQTKRI